MQILVFGSLNMDLVIRTEYCPAAGQTLMGKAFSTSPGGKGANQAVACARLGAQTAMAGRVGDDAFGQELRDTLSSAGVDVELVRVQPGIASGVGVIILDDQAENRIIVVPGANGAVDEVDVQAAAGRLQAGSILLLQLEVPLATVTAMAEAARKCDATVVLDPAPALPLSDDLLRLVDVLTPNQTEAEALVGFPVNTEADARRAADALHARGVRQVVIKMAAQGALWSDGETQATTAAPRVEAVDTVAAGDAFNGGFATALAEGLPLPEAVRFGVAAGALAVTRRGAMEAMPTREAVQNLLQNC